MIPLESPLVTLVKLVDSIPVPPPPVKRPRGRPKVYADRLFLKALVIMVVRHLRKVHELLAVLAEPTAEMQTLRALLTEQGRYPTRRTWERRLKALPDTLPAQIACLGRYLVALLQPWASYGCAVAIHCTILLANGGVWHKKDREQGVVPHTSIDTAAHWTKSGWHGWCYGWKLHLVTTVAAVWIPLAAELTPANAADNEVAPALLRELPAAARFVLATCTTTHPTCRNTVSRLGGSWWPRNMAPIRTPATALKCAACSINYVRWLSRTSTSSSRASSTATVRCRLRACATPNVLPWAPSCSISWRSCIAFNMTSPCGWVSRRS